MAEYDLLKLEIEHLKTGIDKNLVETKESIESLGDKMALEMEGLSSQIDQINLALKGNGKVGVFEQIRMNRYMIYGALLAIALILGGNIYGFNLKSASETLAPKKTGTIKTEDVNALKTVTIPETVHESGNPPISSK